MRNRTGSEKRRYTDNKHKELVLLNQDSIEGDDNSKIQAINLQLELEESYLDFPDPIEYLIGFFASKVEPSYKPKVSSYAQKAVNMTASPKKKPPTVHNNYLQDVEPKVLYKSYYNCKRPSRPSNENLVVNPSMDNSSMQKYKENAALSQSYEKVNSFNNSKTSVEHPSRYSHAGDTDNRL
jgi:hypothetical protein